VLTDAELLQADIKAREDALDVRRSFIVQAPAGSGKTELLIQRYLKLLTIVNNPEEVLAITFTRKAALEMQLRVINALRQARDGFQSQVAHEQFTISIADEVLARDEVLGWQLIQSPGRMRIETVDAFSASIARSLPLSSGLGGAVNTLADATMASIYRNAAAATLDWLTADDDLGSAVERVLVHLDNNTGLYIAYVARMLASREQWLGITGTGPVNEESARAARDQLEQSIERIVTSQVKKLEALLPDHCRQTLSALLAYAAENLATDDKAEHPLTVLRGRADLPAFTAEERNAWQAIANVLLIKSGAWRKSINKNDGFPAGDGGQKKQLLELIQSLHEVRGLRDSLQRVRRLPAPGYSDGQWQVLLALFNLLPLAVAELRRLFSERGVTDHTEVSLAAGQALGNIDQPGDIALSLDYRIQHLLVDEMQDTSINQYDLLKKVTAGWTVDDGRTIFCVGDPMQSIYRFRNAEVGEFLLARRNGIGDIKLESLLLRRNFRSGENLVHWFNTVFDQMLPLQDDISVGAISYAESVPVAAHAGQGEHFVYPLFDASIEEEANQCSQVMQQCLAENPDDDVVLLVRSRTQLTVLLHELRRQNIAYQAVEIDRLTDLPEIIDVLALTRALCHESDRLAWLALLRAPWVGLHWQDLHELVWNDSKSTIPELLHDLDRISGLSNDARTRIQNFVTTIEKYRGRNAHMSLHDRVELAWHALGGPALLHDEEQLENVYRYLDVLDKLDTAGSLADVRELESLLDDERVSSSIKSDCRLQIMTMHKAKGLQFDHVVLFALGRVTRGGSKDVLSWLYVPDENGQNDLIISPVGPRAELENDPLHQFIAATQKDKEQLELDRLLYVACTRARKSVHLIGSVGQATDGETFRDPDARSLLIRLWPAIASAYQLEFERNNSAARADTAVESAEASQSHLVNPVLRRLRDNLQPPLVPALPGSELQNATSATEEEKQVEFYWVGTAARHAGTIVHRFLQRISDGRMTVDAAAITALQPLSQAWARALGVGEEHLDAVCRRVEEALQGIINDERGRWILFGAGDAELAVSGLVDGRVESIIIDRVRIDEKGVHWIVDYKTSTHEGGNLAGFLQQETDRYRPQLEKYVGLYGNLTDAPVRPLLQEFCEIAVENRQPGKSL
jgi:ATP-dependent exoDNAse (exonuclease V) beta subunit